jgi:hypothetical protein
MQTNTTPESLLRELIDSLKGQENARLREAMAREINNHIFIRGTFSTSGGELTSEDMDVILARLQVVQTTLALSARGQSHEAYAPRRHQQPHPKLSPVNLDRLEKEIVGGSGSR